MTLLKELFDTARPVIGVVHLLPLPTSPRWGGSLETVIIRAEQEATALAAGGVHGIILENYHDVPFGTGRVDPAVVSAMTILGQRIRNLVHVPLGLNVLRNDAHSALAIAACVGAAFIRVNVLTSAMVTDQGIIEGDAYHLLRYRRTLGVDVRIFADVFVKHAYPLGSLNLAAAVADTVERGLADGVIISGQATGHSPVFSDLQVARAAAPEVPLLVGSGATADNVGGFLQVADGVIVSTSLKRPGRKPLEQVVDPVRVREFMEAVQHATLHYPSVVV